MSKPISKIFKNLGEHEEKEVRQSYLSAIAYRKQLIKILEEDVRVLQNKMLEEEEYDSPNWNLNQVDKISQIKSLKKFISYLK